MKKYMMGLIAAFVLLGGAMVYAQDYGTSTSAAKPTTSSGGANDILAVASGDSTLALFVKHVNKAGLAKTFQGTGPFTVFAPNNIAFNARTPADISAEHKDLAVLVSTINYHVLSGKTLRPADLATMSGQMLTMDNGQQLKVTVTNGNIMVGNAHVVSSDIAASNGVIYIIDRVQIPATVETPKTAPMPKQGY
jgi:uncharacterized surface protein with fasciclin (FAS1) repeats